MKHTEASKRLIGAKHKTHGHGAIKTPTYIVWQSMKTRCKNPTYKHYQNYGGRGIKVCESWLDFKNFLADMKERPIGMTLDRINNNGNYEPGNCRWATRSQQAQNSRQVKYWFIDGIPYIGLGAASHATGIKRGTLQNRFKSKHFPNYVSGVRVATGYAKGCEP